MIYRNISILTMTYQLHVESFHNMTRRATIYLYIEVFNYEDHLLKKYIFEKNMRIKH